VVVALIQRLALNKMFSVAGGMKAAQKSIDDGGALHLSGQGVGMGARLVMHVGTEVLDGNDSLSNVCVHEVLHHVCGDSSIRSVLTWRWGERGGERVESLHKNPCDLIFLLDTTRII